MNLAMRSVPSDFKTELCCLVKDLFSLTLIPEYFKLLVTSEHLTNFNKTVFDSKENQLIVECAGVLQVTQL